MSFSMASLLIHSEGVSPAARSELKAALDAPEESRAERLLSAARILHRETELECDEVRELVDLSPCGTCD
jgi:hypothetical protein